MGTSIVLVDRKADGFQDEICLEWKRGKREIRGFVLTNFLLSRLISSWNPSVFLSTSTIFISKQKIKNF